MLCCMQLALTILPLTKPSPIESIGFYLMESGAPLSGVMSLLKGPLTESSS